MSRAVVVRYEAKADQADANQALIERVFAELNEQDPGRVRYAAFRLADGAGFVHVAVYDGEENPLSRSAAFAEFQDGIGDRLTGTPERAEASLVGSYRFPVR